MPQQFSLSVIMPALNEEANLEAAVRTTERIVKPFFSDWEILIFNDGSTDGTGKLADKLAKADPKHIRVTHHDKPKNLGGVYKAGVMKAEKTHVIMIPGDNENGDEGALGKIFELTGQADMIIPYVVNTGVRPWQRRVLSKGFVLLTNLVSGCNLRYFNGTVLHRTDLIQRCSIQTDGFGYSAEALVRMIRSGRTYKEVGIELAERPSGQSKALKLDNVVKVIKFLGTLAVDARRPARMLQPLKV